MKIKEYILNKQKRCKQINNSTFIINEKTKQNENLQNCMQRNWKHY